MMQFRTVVILGQKKNCATFEKEKIHAADGQSDCRDHK